MKRRFDPVELDLLLQAVTTEQRGFCACCGEEPSRVGLGLDWALTEVTDTGLPMVRGALCRPCKIAVGRVTVSSRFTLLPKTLARVERYLERPWRDPVGLLERAGLSAPRRNVVAEIGEREAEARKAYTDDIVNWLTTIGVTS